MSSKKKTPAVQSAVDQSFTETPADPQRRRLLVTGASVAGGAGALALLFPMLASMSPSARAKAAGAPVEADVSKLSPGQMMTVEWRGKPVWVVNRTEEALASLREDTGKLSDPASKVTDQQPEYAANDVRSIKPELFVVIGICTHLSVRVTARSSIWQDVSTKAFQHRRT